MKLRGPKCYIGYLRAVDQFGKLPFISFCSGNIILHETIERIFVGMKFADVKQGIMVIRGENISLIGEQVSCLHPLRFFACEAFS